jgi:hypothetical protein
MLIMLFLKEHFKWVIPFNRLLPKSTFSDYHEGYDVFSEMPGGRPSSFQGVTEWGGPPGSAPKERRTAEGGGLSASGGHHPSVTP